jgi:hypothetical protein
MCNCAMGDSATYFVAVQLPPRSLYLHCESRSWKSASKFEPSSSAMAITMKRYGFSSLYANRLVKLVAGPSDHLIKRPGTLPGSTVASFDDVLDHVAFTLA